MSEQLPATPAQAATPGAQGQNGTSTPAPQTPAAPAAGGGTTNQEGQVTIPLKEYRNLQRQDARAKAFEKRFGGKPASHAAGGDQNMSVDEQVIAAQAERDAAVKRALQSDVKVELLGILGKDEFKGIPQSTKDLILKNPGAISQAETLEDALFEIEDYLGDLALKHPATQTQIPANGDQQPKHEVPPVVSGGAPSPAGAEQLEDLTNLRGPAKTQAMLRNQMKLKRMGKA